MLAGQNLGLTIGRAGQLLGPIDGCNNSARPSYRFQQSVLYSREGNYFCRCISILGRTLSWASAILERTPNLAPAFTEALENATGLQLHPRRSGRLASTFGPEDIFHYIYAVLHSPEYRRRYADFLKSDFPRIPLPQDRAGFAELADFGAQLTALHLMESDGSDKPAFDIEGNNRIDRVRYSPSSGHSPGRVFINDKQCFDGVTPEVWGSPSAGTVRRKSGSRTERAELCPSTTWNGTEGYVPSSRKRPASCRVSTRRRRSAAVGQAGVILVRAQSDGRASRIR